ncbi:MAG TPA: hypothetical protein VK796_07880 [Cytophaga sp.]|jgi:hypothetical protein|nr:hypothetical protein [Cytophaga sp.]
MKSFYILLLVLAVSAVSCVTKDGAPGPAGASSLAQQGTISGTLAYVDNDGNAVSAPFSYGYFESASDNKFYYDEAGKQNYQIQLVRRDLKDYNNYINFSNLAGFNISNQFEAPTSGSFDFSLVKVIGGELFEFEGSFSASSSTSSYSITNYSFDATTGRLIFDFVLNIDPADINSSDQYDDTQSATVTGRVDVILNRTLIYTTPTKTQLPS